MFQLFKVVILTKLIINYTHKNFVFLSIKKESAEHLCKYIITELSVIRHTHITHLCQQYIYDYCYMTLKYHTIIVMPDVW